MLSTPNGYFGRYLRVDLTTRTSEPVPLPANVLRRFIGGSGLGTWILLSESADPRDPLSPQAPIAFVFSPLVGSPLTTSAKFAVVSQSPLTNRLNDSLSSSHFAISGKKTGYDAIVIVGAAETPTCLAIDDAGVRFESADDVWGLTVSESESALRSRLGKRYRFAVIGPAGERLVRFATISHDGRHAGRGGSGAVMGSKNLKAVAVGGTRAIPVARPAELAKFAKRLAEQSLGPATEKYRELGTVSNLLTFNRLGTLPTRNFQQSTFEHASAIAPEVFAKTRKRTRASCAACTIGCEHIFELEAPTGDEGAENHGVRLEYESLFALGSLCGIGDPETVLQAAARCDELGIDTISAGATIAFAMECAERGLIDEPDLRFGRSDSLRDLIEAIGARTGLGEILSRGTRAAAAEIGGGSEDFAPHVKGLEIPGYEPRALQTMALGFAVGSRGADHNRSGAYQADFSEDVDRFQIDTAAVHAAIATEDEAAVMDSLILCKFLRGVFDDRFAGMSEMLALVTGWDVSPDELHETAKRIVTAKKWYNVQAGWTPAEDTLPRRFFAESIPSGASKGAVLSESRLQEMIRTYNLARGWTEDGWVPQDRLVDLDAPVLISIEEK